MTHSLLEKNNFSLLGGCDGKFVLGSRFRKKPANVPTSSSDRAFGLVPREPLVGTRITDTRSSFGAPPPVPRTIQSEQGSEWCLGCHAKENRVRYKHKAIAPNPHAEYSHYLQCHVKRDGDITRWEENTFVGLDFPGKGSRAHDFAHRQRLTKRLCVKTAHPAMVPRENTPSAHRTLTAVSANNATCRSSARTIPVHS
jgi:hypothetical protein